MGFINVYSEIDKEKLVSKGYEFICSVPQGKFNIYQFKDNNTQMNFSNENIKYHRSNLMLF